MTLMGKDSNSTAFKYLYHKKPSKRPWAQLGYTYFSQTFLK